MDKKDVVVLILFLCIAFFIYYIYNSENKQTEIISNIIDREGFINCKKAPEDIQNMLENLTEFFDGIFYDKPILLCILNDNKIYCLQSTKETIGNYTIIYFDKICMVQKQINKNLEYVIVDYNYAKTVKTVEDLLNGYKIKKVILSDKNIAKALMGPPGFEPGTSG